MLFKKTAGTFVTKVITSLINLAIVIVVSQWMGAHGKGEASMIGAGITMLILFCNVIGGASLVYLVPRHNIFQLTLISNIWSIVVCTISYFLLSWTEIIPSQFVVHVCLLSLISSFLGTNITVLIGKEKIRLNNYITILQSLINFIVLFVLVKSFERNNTASYIASLYVALVTCFIVSLYMILPFFKGFYLSGIEKIIKELAKYGITNQAGHMMKFASFRLSYFLLNSYCGSNGVGIYSNGTSIIESILLISSSISTVQYATIANSNDNLSSKDLTIRLTRISILICALVMIPLLAIPASFYSWLFGIGFNGIRTVILFLAPGILFYNIALIVGHYFSGIGRYTVNTLGNLAGLIVTIVFSIIFISSYTIYTAAIISTMAYVATTLTILYYFAKDSKVNLARLIPVPSDITWTIKKIRSLRFSFRPEEMSNNF